MGKVPSIHGAAVLLALVAGNMLAGVIGALLAVPVTALGSTIIKTGSGRDTAESTAEEPAAVWPAGLSSTDA